MCSPSQHFYLQVITFAVSSILPGWLTLRNLVVISDERKHDLIKLMFFHPGLILYNYIVTEYICVVIIVSVCIVLIVIMISRNLINDIERLILYSYVMLPS